MKLEFYNWLESVFGKFPRDFGTPYRRAVFSWIELMRHLEGCNFSGYISVYQGSSISLSKSGVPTCDWEIGTVDRIIFEFEPKIEKSKEATLKQLEEARKEALKVAERYYEITGHEPLIWLSGHKSFYIMYFCEPVELNHPKETIKELVEVFKSNYDLKCLDERVPGDLARLITIPNTLKVKDGKAYGWAVPISLEELRSMDVLRGDYQRLCEEPRLFSFTHTGVRS
jgi:hypothetical protein